MDHLGYLLFNLSITENDKEILEKDLKSSQNKLKKYCIHEDCKVSKRYNYPGEIGGIYCNSHKLTNMVNVVDFL